MDKAKLYCEKQKLNSTYDSGYKFALHGYIAGNNEAKTEISELLETLEKAYSHSARRAISTAIQMIKDKI